MTIGQNSYYMQTLLVRRDEEMTLDLGELKLITHKDELDLFPAGEDRIVRVYYAMKGEDIYLLTLSGSPEDIVTSEKEIRNLLASIRFSAADAISSTNTR